MYTCIWHHTDIWMYRRGRHDVVVTVDHQGHLPPVCGQLTKYNGIAALPTLQLQYNRILFAYRLCRYIDFMHTTPGTFIIIIISTIICSTQFIRQHTTFVSAPSCWSLLDRNIAPIHESSLKNITSLLKRVHTCKHTMISVILVQYIQKQLSQYTHKCMHTCTFRRR